VRRSTWYPEDWPLHGVWVDGDWMADRQVEIVETRRAVRLDQPVRDSSTTTRS